uniref:Uncharacterized protein n=1 Tax=Rhizophora mucronata TaxID=61149 RepID=A0A2P2P142_RHIMU
MSIQDVRTLTQSQGDFGTGSRAWLAMAILWCKTTLLS